MDHALRLNLGATFASSAPRAKFLEPLAPPTYPFTSPAWSLPQKPRSIALLDVFKNHELLATYTVDQKPLYLIGRNAVVCDIVLGHCSISRLHATIIHHKDGATYLVDLGSCHGTFIDDVKLKALQPTLIVHGSTLRFGASSRSYSFKAFETREQILERVQSRIGLDPEEMEVEQNTLLNQALSYRLGFSIPETHKATDAEGDDPMALFPVRQMEVSTSLVRRTQSEDNTLAGVFPISTSQHASVANSVVMANQGELGRKRSRAQSAGLPSTQAQSLQHLRSPLNQAMPAPHSQDEINDPLSKRVHFSEKPAETIPDRPVYFSPDHSPCHAPSAPSCPTPSPKILPVPESELPSEKVVRKDPSDFEKRLSLSPPPLRLDEVTRLEQPLRTSHKAAS